MTAPLIGFIGRKRSGKDTAADRLIGRYGFRKVMFAGPLKQAALDLNPLVGPAPLPGDPVSRYRPLRAFVDELGWEQAKDVVPEVRTTLQRLGTDAIRALDDGFWVRQAMTSVRTLREERLDSRAVPVVMTDVRFPNEAQAIADAGGTLIRIVRPGQADDGDTHPSETALDDWPTVYTLANDGDVLDLWSKVDVLYPSLQ